MFRRALTSYNGWSRNNFPFSMEGCVFYAPLWQEDVQGSPFLSYDQYHHTCTVTGATWGSQGRTFNGIDGKISIGNNAVLTSATQTIMFWLPNKGTLKTCDIYSRSRNADEWPVLGIGYEGTRMFLSANSIGGAVAGTTVMEYADISNGDMFAFVLSGTNADAYRNGVFLKSITKADGWAQEPTFATQIGAAVFGYYFDGTVGEVVTINRALSAGEIMQYYLATKWRYGV